MKASHLFGWSVFCVTVWALALWLMIRAIA